MMNLVKNHMRNT